MKAYRYDKSSLSGMRMASDIPLPNPDKLKSGEVIVSVKVAALNPIDYKASRSCANIILHVPYHGGCSILHDSMTYLMIMFDIAWAGIVFGLPYPMGYSVD